MPYVQTTDGGYVAGKPDRYVAGKHDPNAKAEGYTLEQAQADCAVRNKRAEALGIRTRYEVVQD